LILLKTHDTTFEEYRNSLSVTGKKNLRYVEKTNRDMGYQEVIYEPGEVREFMEMWEQQPIRGVKRQWAFGIDHLTNLDRDGRIRVFVGYEKNKEYTRSLHFVQTHHDGYIECHPPMWKKSPANERRYIAKYMWFSLIKFAISDPDMKWLDFGGGRDDSWREMIRDRSEYPNPRYKWLYIPEGVKKNPDSQPDLCMIEDGGMRRLVEI